MGDFSDEEKGKKMLKLMLIIFLSLKRMSKLIKKTINWRMYLLMVLSVYGAASSATEINESRPNLIVIVVDDQRWDELGVAGHSFIETPNIDRLANEGVLFTNSYTVTPLCSPNRASILTGQYISAHGITDNIARNQSSHRLDLFAKDLQIAGYDTAHVGKWHMGNDPTPRPGYDYWVSYAGQGRSVNPELYENGKMQTIEGYMSDILTDKAIGFINKKRQAPFFLYLAHKSIHPEVKQLDDSSIDFSYPMKYVAAPRHVGRYSDKVFPRRDNVNLSAEQLTAKPVLAEILKEKAKYKNDKEWGALIDWGTAEQTIRDRSEMLLAVDEGVGKIIKDLEERGLLENTMILLTSDNGYFYGEQGGLSIERRMPYEEGVRVPFVVRYPKLIKAGMRSDKFVLSIDIAPTMLEMAGITKGKHIQGDSIVPILQDEDAQWRDSFLMEYVGYEKPMPWMIDTSYKVIRKNNYKYIHWIQRHNADELYDLESDPYEMNNIISNPKHTKLLVELKAELTQLVGKANGLNY